MFQKIERWYGVHIDLLCPEIANDQISGSFKDEQLPYVMEALKFQYGFNYPKLLSIFFPSGKPEIFVLSNEELATLYHFPGMVSETPSFKRIESKIAKPPSNLPV